MFLSPITVSLARSPKQNRQNFAIVLDSLLKSVILIKLFYFPFFKTGLWRRIEVVITSATGNRVVRKGSRVRIPPSPPLKCQARDEKFYLWLDIFYAHLPAHSNNDRKTIRIRHVNPAKRKNFPLNLDALINTIEN